MKFKIRPASGEYGKYINILNEFNYKDDYIELIHVEDLIRLVKQLDCDVIIDKPYDENDEPSLMIYDDYLE